MARKKRERAPRSYVETHNSAVIKYQRAARIMIWAGVLNFVGLIISHIQLVMGQVEKIQFHFCFGISNFFFNLLRDRADMPSGGFYTIIYIVSLALTIGAVLLGVYSSQGKKKFLFASLISYFVDWVMMLVAFFTAVDPQSELMVLFFSGGIHIIITFFLVFALYEYYNVINIEKRFEKPTVNKEPEGEENNNGVK